MICVSAYLRVILCTFIGINISQMKRDKVKKVMPLAMYNHYNLVSFLCLLCETEEIIEYNLDVSGLVKQDSTGISRIITFHRYVSRET